MNTVSKDLLTMQSNVDNAAVLKLLEEMGVKRKSPRDILHNHIFPILESEEWRVRSIHWLSIVAMALIVCTVSCRLNHLVSSQVILCLRNCKLTTIHVFSVLTG